MRALILVLLLGASGPAYAANGAPAVREVHVKIKGMVCSYCSQGLLKSFKKEPAVADATASLKDHDLKLFLKSDLSDARIAELVKDSGLQLGEIVR